jgi:hypothetical protein
MLMHTKHNILSEDFMWTQCNRAIPFSAIAVLMLGTQANADSAASPTVVLPQTYETIIASAGALVTSSAAALKNVRSDERSLAFRLALTKKIMALSAEATTIQLDKSDTDPDLGERALLCSMRKDYVKNVAQLNYLNTLVQKLNAVSKPATAPADIVGALKLLLATSSYSISDAVQSKPANISSIQAETVTACETDLKSYDKAYYGQDAGGISPPASAAAAAPALGVSLAFLGPIGTLIDTFASIIQPIFIDASMMVDEARRRGVIENALNDPATRAKIETTGRDLATAVDNFATTSRRSAAGFFVEQLVSIREMQIDLSKHPECQGLASRLRLPSGAPSAAFVACWKAAWGQLQPAVTNLATAAGNYDTLADAGNVNAQKLFGTILADYDLISAGKAEATNVFWDDVTQFITFANAISTAASKSNTAAVQKDIAAISK